MWFVANFRLMCFSDSSWMEGAVDRGQWLATGICHNCSGRYQADDGDNNVAALKSTSRSLSEEIFKVLSALTLIGQRYIINILISNDNTGLVDFRLDRYDIELTAPVQVRSNIPSLQNSMRARPAY